MTDKEILKEAIKKAINNGWDISPWEQKTDLLSCENNIFLMSDYAHYPLLIFSHDFAKAFWGEEDILIHQFHTPELAEGVVKYNAKRWEYHLQKMILEKKPLEYLEEFL